MVRSAGGVAQLMAKEGKYAHIKLPSGEVRLVPSRCRATIGQLGNVEHENITIGKAGRSRWLGIRPAVRGSAMNRSTIPTVVVKEGPIGRKSPLTPWGKPTLGYKTRPKRKSMTTFLENVKSNLSYY